MTSTNVPDRVLGCKLHSCGVDWITATTRDESWQQPLLLIGQGSIEDEIAAGHKPRPLAWLGYRGWAAGGVAYGIGAQGAILRLSGAAAAEKWHYAVQHAHNVSRLDVQCTCEFTEAAPQLHQALYNVVLAQPRVAAGLAAASCTEWSGGGGMVTYGRRVSDVYIRIYDKGVESGQDGPGKLWRWEVELKGSRALAAARGLHRASDQWTACASLVHKICCDRGVPVGWDSRTEVVPRISRLGPADDERTLKWVRDQVAPALTRLYDLGHGEALRALLSDVLLKLGGSTNDGRSS
jgi:DNA relaxase NicK